MSAAVIGTALVVTGCSPVEMGAAAIVGSQRITIATLDTEVTNLSQSARLYPGIVQLTPTQLTQATLTWLVRFKVNDELAQQAGITISPAQVQYGRSQFYAAARSQAEANGLTSVTLNLIMTAYGIPPNKSDELGRYEAIELQFLKDANGGTIPASSSAQTALVAKYEHAQCVAAKALNILINPQFGRLDYSQLLVVPTPAPVSRPEGPAAAPSASGLAPAC